MLDRVREDLKLRLEDGARMAEVERELVKSAPQLNEDERAASWLLAWAYRPRHQDTSERLVAVTG